MAEEKKYMLIEPQHVVLSDFACEEGWILDFGGGGEGIIGQVKGSQVVAIDRLKSELEEALERGCTALPIIMDGTNLQFLDNTFHTVTAFYALMFVPVGDLENIFKEIYRVMRPHGQWIIWESEFENPSDSKFDVLAFELKVELPSGKIVDTGYGTRKRKQSSIEFEKLAKKTGFSIEKIEETKNQFVLYLRK